MQERIVEQACERIRCTLEWRETIQLELIMADKMWQEREQNEYRKLLCYDFLGLCTLGRPVMVERCGVWDAEAVVKSAEADPDTFAKLHCMACEILRRAPRRPGCRDPLGAVLIMDLKDYNRKHVWFTKRLARAFISLAKLDTAHYPEMMGRIFIVNMPIAFSVISALVRPFLPEATVAKVSVHSGVPHELVELVGRHVLPRALGGEREACFPYDTSAPVSTAWLEGRDKDPHPATDAGAAVDVWL